jgi:hypothetical protein
MGTHSAQSAHGAPILRLRTRFGAAGAESAGKADPPAESAPALSLLDLPPDLFETWKERACMMHFDGGMPWPRAEAEALADVLRVAGVAQAAQGGTAGEEVVGPVMCGDGRATGPRRHSGGTSR